MSEPEFDSPVASVHRGEGIKVEKRLIVNRPTMELWKYWRNFENLPRIMKHLESVSVLSKTGSYWVSKGLVGTHFQWDAEIHNEIPGELIAWRSVTGDVNHAGSVRFREVSSEKTEVIVELRYEPPAGKLGAAVAKLFGEEPGQQIESDLQRFKEVMEAAAPAIESELRPHPR